MKNDFGLPESVIEAFTKGDCWTLAGAIHNKTGWNIVTMSDGDDPQGWSHVAVWTPAGTVLDIQGEWTADEWFDQWETTILSADPIVFEWNGADPDNTFDDFVLSCGDQEPQYRESPTIWASRVLAAYTVKV